MRAVRCMGNNSTLVEVDMEKIMRWMKMYKFCWLKRIKKKNVSRMLVVGTDGNHNHIKKGVLRSSKSLWKPSFMSTRLYIKWEFMSCARICMNDSFGTSIMNFHIYFTTISMVETFPTTTTLIICVEWKAK